jgi:hypothetical protein
VIKKVVPLSKHVLAVFEVTLHQLDPSIRSWVLKPHYSKSSRSRNIVIVDPNFTDVDLASVFNVDSDSGRNHAFESLKLNLA